MWRAGCTDAFREGGADRPHGLYWGLRLVDPEQPGLVGDPAVTVWKMDLWVFDPTHARELAAQRRA